MTVKKIFYAAFFIFFLDLVLLIASFSIMIGEPTAGLEFAKKEVVEFVFAKGEKNAQGGKKLRAAAEEGYENPKLPRRLANITAARIKIITEKKLIKKDKPLTVECAIEVRSATVDEQQVRSQKQLPSRSECRRRPSRSEQWRVSERTECRQRTGGDSRDFPDFRDFSDFSDFEAVIKTDTEEIKKIRVTKKMMTAAMDAAVMDADAINADMSATKISNTETKESTDSKKLFYTFSTTYAPDRTGVIPLACRVDYANEVDESNEVDNRFITNLLVIE